MTVSTTVSTTSFSKPAQDMKLLTPKDASLLDVDSRHSALLVDRDADVELQVQRSGLLKQAVGFYSKACDTPQILQRNLVIEFRGEAGCDLGGLKAEFLTLLLDEVNTMFFEGSEFRRIPKKDWDLTSQFELVGMLISHSVLQGGPSLTCLSPAIYSLISKSGSSCDHFEEMPSKEDIPMNMATAQLHDFIEKVCCTGAYMIVPHW